MRIAFFGTPEFAIPALMELTKSHHQVVGAVTAPDRPRGRGQEVIPTPIARAAGTLNLPILKPDKLKDPEFLTSLRRWNADLFVVVAFRIMPPEVFAMPTKGSINLHASLLPAYRGAAPIQWALWNGEKETGVTTFQIERDVDVGNLLKQRRVEVLEADDAGSLSQRLAEIGAELLLETLSELEANSLVVQPQDNSRASAAPKIKPEHCLINWQLPAQQIRNQVRALSPEPAAYTFFNNQQLKIFRSEVLENTNEEPPGTLCIDDHRLIAVTDSGLLHIMELQLPGKKRMTTEAFLRGYRTRGTFRLENIRGQ